MGWGRGGILGGQSSMYTGPEGNELGKSEEQKEVSAGEARRA